MSDKLIPVVVHFDEAGEISYYVPKQVQLLIVDERAPDDRVYAWATHSSLAEIAAVIGDSDIGDADDGMLTVNQVQSIKAKLWLNDGGKLS